MSQYRVTYEPKHVTVPVEPELYPYSRYGRPGSVLDIALANGVHIDHACGGQLTCGMCRVVVEQGEENLSPRSGQEDAYLKYLGVRDPAVRLACQAVVQGDVTVRIGR